MNSEMMKTRGLYAAASFLKKQGYELLANQWHTEDGDIDIVAQDNDCLVFVQVFVTEGVNTGLQKENLSLAERNAMELRAAQYLSQTDKVDIPIRFDNICIQVLSETRAFLRHHRNAFGVSI